jgi:hypothetical protein
MYFGPTDVSQKNDDRAVLWSTDKAIATIGSLSTLLSDLVSDVLVALLCLTHNAIYIYIYNPLLS